MDPATGRFGPETRGALSRLGRTGLSRRGRYMVPSRRRSKRIRSRISRLKSSSVGLSPSVSPPASVSLPGVGHDLLPCPSPAVARDVLHLGVQKEGPDRLRAAVGVDDLVVLLVEVPRRHLLGPSIRADESDDPWPSSLPLSVLTAALPRAVRQPASARGRRARRPS